MEVKGLILDFRLDAVFVLGASNLYRVGSTYMAVLGDSLHYPHLDLSAMLFNFILAYNPTHPPSLKAVGSLAALCSYF
jgi:hypothetical protein